MERVGGTLRRLGWQVAMEVSFAHFGERGSIDILAWHAATRSLLVVEVKTAIGAMEETLRVLDVKVRLAPLIADDRSGWINAAAVSRLLVVPEDRTVRRHLHRHAVTTDSVLPLRSRAMRGWLRAPLGRTGGVWFVSPPSDGPAPGLQAGHAQSAAYDHAVTDESRHPVIPYVPAPHLTGTRHPDRRTDQRLERRPSQTASLRGP